MKAKGPRSFYVHILPALQNNFSQKTDAPMVYNRQKMNEKISLTIFFLPFCNNTIFL